MKRIPLILTALLISAFYCSTIMAEEKSIFKGKVLDIERKPVEGAEIYVYNSPAVKRPADFISQRTNKNGDFRVILPAGKYWAVARLRSGEKYGPLMPGDKHSGEPVEIELAPDKEIGKDFNVADMREVARLRKKTREDYIKIKGRILDKNGSPVKMAYAIANKNKAIPEIPDYISAWTDEEGYYILYLPPGEFYIGSATKFPPEASGKIYKELVLDADRTEMDIIINSSE